MPWLGYTRVSRVGDRSETLISPDLQAERIRAYAGARGIEVEILDPELDVSGGKIDRPILNQALGKLEAGEANGLIVAQLDRLSRMDISDALRTIKRIEASGGQVIAVAENFDAGTPEGRFARNMFLSMSQMQLDRYRAQFAAAKEQAVRRGIWPAPQPPRGYRVGSGRRLEPTREAAKVIRAFEARAAGAAWSKVATILGSGISGAAKAIQNRAYLGEINLGTLRNPSAHEPLVSRALWEAAQLRHPRPARGRHGPSLLVGLVRCAACGYAMTPDGNRSGYRGYRCQPRKVHGFCSAPALISARLLDPFVEAVVLHHAKGLTYSLDAPTVLAEAEQALEAAETELAAYQLAQRVSELGEDNFAVGMRSRVEVVNAARQELAQARASTPLRESGVVADLWPTLPVEARRHALRSSLSAVVVSRGRRSVTQRVRLIDPEGAPVEIPASLREAFGKS